VSLLNGTIFFILINPYFMFLIGNGNEGFMRIKKGRTANNRSALYATQHLPAAYSTDTFCPLKNDKHTSTAPASNTPGLSGRLNNPSGNKVSLMQSAKKP
jgi:hypothetical protein